MALLAAVERELGPEVELFRAVWESREWCRCVVTVMTGTQCEKFAEAETPQVGALMIQPSREKRALEETVVLD